MNRTFLSVFFSVLLGSTLGHEYHQKAHELSQRRNHDSRHNVASFRAGGLDTCSYSCPNPKPWDWEKSSYVHLVIFPGASAFGFSNPESKVVVIFSTKYLLLMNGETGVSIFVDLGTEQGLFFDKGSNSQLWNASKTHLIDYIKDLGSLANIKKLENGQKFQVQTAPKNVTSAALTIVKGVSEEIEETGKSNQILVLRTLVAIGLNLKGSEEVIELLFATTKTQVIVISRGLVRTANIFISLQLLNKKMPNGIRRLITSDFSLSFLLSAPSGVDVIIYLLEEAGNTLDLSKELGDDIMKNPTGILEIIFNTDGGSYGGLSGLTSAIYVLLKYSLKQISLEDVIDILIQIIVANTVKISKQHWKDVTKRLEDVFDNQIKTHNTGKAWAPKKKILQDILDDKLVAGNINISSVLNTLVATSGQVQVIDLVKILLELRVIVSLTTIVSTLLLRLIWFLISGQGILYISKLFSNIKINIDYSSTKSIGAQLVGGFTVTSSIRQILESDIYGLISHLPVIGPIADTLDASLKTTGVSSEVTVPSALKENGSVFLTLKGWIWYILGLSGGKEPSSSGIAGQGIIGGGVAINWSSKWTIVSKPSGGGSSSGGGTSTSGNSGSGTSGVNGSTASSSGASSSSSSGSSGSIISGGSSSGSSSTGSSGSSISSGSGSGSTSSGGSAGSIGGWQWAWGGGSGGGSSGGSSSGGGLSSGGASGSEGGSSTGGGSGGSSGSGGSKGSSGWPWSFFGG